MTGPVQPTRRDAARAGRRRRPGVVIAVLPAVALGVASGVIGLLRSRRSH